MREMLEAPSIDRIGGIYGAKKVGAQDRKTIENWKLQIAPSVNMSSHAFAQFEILNFSICNS